MPMVGPVKCPESRPDMKGHRSGAKPFTVLVEGCEGNLGEGRVPPVSVEPRREQEGSEWSCLDSKSLNPWVTTHCATC